MSLPDEHEQACLGLAYPDLYWGRAGDGFPDLPPLAPVQATGRYASFVAADGSTYQTPQDLPQRLPVHQTTQLDPKAWGFRPSLELQLWLQHFMPSSVSEGPTWPPLPSHDAPVVDGSAQYSSLLALPPTPPHTLPSHDAPVVNGFAQYSSPLVLQPTPPQTPRSVTQSGNTAWSSTDVQRNSLQVLLHNAQASSGRAISRKTTSAVKRQYALDNIQPIGAPYRNKETGELQGRNLRIGRRVTVRGKLDPVGRDNAKRMRELGACGPCRQSKIKCDHFRVQYDYELCTSCAKLPSFTKSNVLRMPCFRSTVSDADFFRLAPSEKSVHKSTKRGEIFAIEDIAPQSGPARRIQLTQGVGDRKLMFSVSEFVPIEGDQIAYKWKDAQGSHTVTMPPFCISDVQDAQKTIIQYVRDSRRDYLSKYLKGTPVITRVTFGMALEFSSLKQGSPVQLALDLWSASRVIEESWLICGGDTLGVAPIQDLTSPWFEKVPVTPIMDTQLDQFVIKGVLVPRRDAVLEKLQGMIKNFTRDAWFELYLTIFVLLSTIEAAGAHQWSFARRYGLRTRFANHPEMEKFFDGCKILLAHFHFVCRGAHPIQSLNWKDPEMVRFAQLNAKQVEFMEITQRLVREAEEQLKALRPERKFDTPLYWCHQLFDDKWRPEVIELEDEYP